MTELLPSAAPHVYLSPHFDDIALSCGGLAALQHTAGGRGLCITVFAAPPPADEPFSAYAQRLHTRWGETDPLGGNVLRRTEERAATDLLGLDLILLDYPDAIYRHGRYLGHDDIFGAIHPVEADLPATLAVTLADSLAARGFGPDATLYAPLGLGHHVDHQLTYQAAALLARQGWPVVYYEDFPYAAKPDAHAARFAELGADLTPACAAIDSGIDTKIAAIAAYPSQISSLFPSLAAMPDAVRAYAAEVAAAWRQERAGTIPACRYAERYWRPLGV